MNQTLTLGPLVLPLALLLGVAAYTVAGLVGQRVGRPQGVDVERHLLRLLLAGALAARLAFVLQFHDVYLQAPLGIIDIRDGGWKPLVGLGVAAAYAGALAMLRAPLRKPLAAALGAGAAVWLAGALALGAASNDEVRMPPLALTSMEGAQVALASFEGKPTVVNLWATWCPPCRREMPVLQQAQAARPDLNFVFLNQGESPQKVAAYLQASRLQLRNVLLDARGEAGAQLGHRALPTTLFFDARGRLVDTRVGELSAASLAERLRALSPSSAD